MEINPVIIQELIKYVNEIFPKLHYNFTNPFPWARDSFSYYLSNHCVSFARILKALFPMKTVFFLSKSHLIIEIEGFYFDVRGILTDVDLNEYYATDENNPYINLVFNNTDELEEKLETTLIQLCKIKYDELLKEYDKAFFAFTK